MYLPKHTMIVILIFIAFFKQTLNNKHLQKKTYKSKAHISSILNSSAEAHTYFHKNINHFMLSVVSMQLEIFPLKLNNVHVSLYIFTIHSTHMIRENKIHFEKKKTRNIQVFPPLSQANGNKFSHSSLSGSLTGKRAT
jgi:hypothetical protein